jgi:alpha-ketoglutarate-dependent taurine dioxygenase
VPILRQPAQQECASAQYFARSGSQAIGGLGSLEAAWHSDMSYIDNPPTASVF